MNLFSHSPIKSIACFTITSCILFGGLEVQGQIIPDQSLRHPSVVTSDGSLYKIKQGTSQGKNLFHSFRHFSLSAGETASIQNHKGISNIFIRVTGNEISFIGGQIRAKGTANLFFISPTGIEFGPNSSLNIGGSFLASSADSILFSDGFKFNANRSDTSPLLTIRSPTGLSFGSTPGPIESHAEVTLDTSGPFPRAVISSQLRVSERKTLGLIGGHIKLKGGQFISPGGSIELASITQPSVVGIQENDTGFQFNFTDLNHLGNIRLDNVTQLDVSGEQGGAVKIHGRNVTLAEGAQINSITIGTSKGADIEITASESLKVQGTTTIPELFEPFIAENGLLVPLFSNITTDSVAGSAGNISIQTKRLSLLDGARITANADPNRQVGIDQANRGGDIFIDATDSVEVSGFTNPVLASPDIPIPANIVEVNGSSILATIITNRTEQAGDLIIKTGKLLVKDAGFIGSRTIGTGNGGEVKISARDSITVEGVRAGGSTRSAIDSSVVFQFPELIPLAGNGGGITLSTHTLNIRNGGEIDSSTLAGGDSGSIDITAKQINISGESEGLPSQIEVSSAGSGNAGDIEIRTDALLLSNKGEINVSGGTLNPFLGINGTGPAGSLRVEGGLVILSDGKIRAQTTSNLGGGNLLLNVDNIFLRNSSQISAEASANGTGGNITINSVGGFLLAPQLNNNDILAIADEGKGGEIIVNAEQIFSFIEQNSPSNLINNSTNDISASSANGVQGSVNLNALNIDPSQKLTELPTVFLSKPLALDPLCRATNPGSSFVFGGSGGVPPTPIELRNTSLPWEDWNILGLHESKLVQESIEKSSKAPGITKEIIAIKEAKGWIKTHNGPYQLVLEASTTNQNTFAQSKSCRPINTR